MADCRPSQTRWQRSFTNCAHKQSSRPATNDLTNRTTASATAKNYSSETAIIGESAKSGHPPANTVFSTTAAAAAAATTATISIGHLTIDRKIPTRWTTAGHNYQMRHR